MPTVLGLCLGVVLQLVVVLPRLGLGNADLDRIVQLGAHLKSRPYDGGAWAVAAGDSVTVEGLDAAQVAAAAPGWSVENVGLNGCDRGQLRLVLPSLLAARPRAVVLVLRPRSIAEPIAVTHDGAYAYVLGGFVSDWPAGWVTGAMPGIAADVAEDFAEPTLAARLHFRSAVAETVNSGVRARLRRGIRATRPDDWTAPFNMDISISGAALDRHLAVLERETADATVPAMGAGVGAGPDTERHEAEMRRLILMVRDAGVTPIVVIAPIHPRLRGPGAHSTVAARLRRGAEAWAVEAGGVYADASLLLDETGFADAQHLNAHGRARLSAFVGAHLPPPGTDH